jgi:TolB-like protein/DNA-binding winged helix-turn-helix (wHTH) protein
MEGSPATPLRIGSWRVDPAAGQISNAAGEAVRLEARAMRLLLCLAAHAGEVVSIDDLLNQVWAEVTVTPDSVYQAVASLRRVLGDDPKQPAYIATAPRLGYRMVATVGAWVDQPIAQNGSSRAAEAMPAAAASVPRSRFRTGFAWAAVTVVCLALVVAFQLHGKLGHHPSSALPVLAPPPQRSIAVLPFLDLTEGMKDEEFADGMTEELIDRLSKIPGLRVPAPTSSFYFKGKQIPVADIARALGVAYVLDGSVRKSGGRLRVAARLIRADNGYVAWSESYDRPAGDILMIQDEIAGEVTKALSASIDARAGP